MDLSILIPARSEQFLSRTIEDILFNIEADTEIIAVLDGEWAEPPIPQHERVNVIYVSEAIGQRAATNLACKLSKAKYVMQLDAHCSFDKGFDRKMLEFFKEVGDDITGVPIMRNLYCFDWKCHRCGWKKDQGLKPERCEQCNDSRYIKMKIMWIGKHNPQSTSYCFNSEPHFKYFEEYKHREPYITDKEKKGITETMSLQGFCFMCTREKYWSLNLCDEEFGSWGNQGIEVACKTWLSGGRVLVNHKTWYAHLFRTQDGFSFPYGQNHSEVQETKKKVKDLIWEGKYPQAIYPLSWLIDKFTPVPGWSGEDIINLKNNENK